MEFYKTYYFDTKYQRISSATYLRELLYSMFTILQPTKAPYIPRPAPKFSTKQNLSQQDSVGYQILLTWQEFHEKLIHSLDKENISSWTLEELSIWRAMIGFLYTCLMEFATKNGWGALFKHKENLENLSKYYKICENAFKADSHYLNSIQPSYNELFGGLSPCNLETVKGVLPIIEGKVLLNSQHDFNRLFGIEESFLVKGTEVPPEEVTKLKNLVLMVQERVKLLKNLLQK